MFSVPKELANGRIKIYIRYRNEEGRLVNYPVDKHPEFKSKKDADDWIVSHSGKVKLSTHPSNVSIAMYTLLSTNFP